MIVGEGNSIDGALTAYYDPLEGGARDDKSRLEAIRTERRAVKEWADKRNIVPNALASALCAVRDRQQVMAYRASKAGPLPKDGPPSQESWEAAHRTLIHEEGDSLEAANKLWTRAMAGTQILAKELPFSLQRRAEGAMSDTRILRFAAMLAPEGS